VAAPNPVLLFAYANDRLDDQRYMRNLPEERRTIEAALRGIEDAGTVDVVHCPNATIDEVLDKCQRCGERLAVFHFAGHADGKTLLFEHPDGSPAASHARSIAEFLATFGGLRLVVLNGCSTQDQVESMLALGIPAVVATSTLVRDDVATSFAGHLYAALAAGETVETAFRRASSAVVVQYTTGTDGTLSALCRDVVAENMTISLPSLWKIHGFGIRQFRLITAADLVEKKTRKQNQAGAGGVGNVSDGGPRLTMRQTLWNVRLAVMMLLQGEIDYLNREVVTRQLPIDQVHCEPLALAYTLVSDKKLGVALLNSAAERPFVPRSRPISPPQLDGLLATFAQIDLPPSDPGHELMHPLSVYHNAYFRTDLGWSEAGSLTIESWFRFVHRSMLLCAMIERIVGFHKREGRRPSEAKTYARNMRELIKMWNESCESGTNTIFGHKAEAWLRS
jgi:hypothetical protein